VDLLFFFSGGLSQPPSLSPIVTHASRNSSATVRSTTARAMTMPPMDNAAMACAMARLWGSFSIRLRSKNANHRFEHRLEGAPCGLAATCNVGRQCHHRAGILNILEMLSR
jgi:hypothetical protein